MSDSKSDKKADKTRTEKPDVEDRGESIGLMEPMLVGESSKHRASLNDLTVELASRAAGFRRSLPEGVLTALADLVRAMNCYYSNLIEGHDTHPVDIERALKNDYSAEPEKRNLQLEARAHIAVQQWIDGGGLRGRATTAGGLIEIHRRFGDLLPEELFSTEDPDRRAHQGDSRRVPQSRCEGGQPYRGEPWRCAPFSASVLNTAYANMGRIDSIIAAATAHHRLLWIHPFLDGNGRVARLMSHAMLLETLDTGGVWSIARGLARNEGATRANSWPANANGATIWTGAAI